MEKSAARPVTYLLVGASGTGKTTIARSLCERLGVNATLVVNGSSAGFPEGESVEWEDVPSEREKVAYVIEDLEEVNRIGKRKEILYQLLNVTSRAKASPVLVLTHSVCNTGVTGLLPFFSRIIFTKTPALKTQLAQSLTRVGFPHDAREAVLRTFEGLTGRRYLSIDPRAGTHATADAMQERREEEDGWDGGATKERILSFFTHLKEELGYVASVVDFLVANLPLGCIASVDLSVALKTKKGMLRKVSVIDYVYSLVKSDSPPSRGVRLLHRWVKTLCVFPDLFVKNKWLRGDRVRAAAKKKRKRSAAQMEKEEEEATDEEERSRRRRRQDSPL